MDKEMTGRQGKGMTIAVVAFGTAFMAGVLPALAASEPAPLTSTEITAVDLTNCELGETVFAKGNALAAGMLIDECLTQPVKPETRGHYLEIKGAADLQLKLYEYALADFDEALDLRPGDVGLLNGKGASLLGLNRADDAVQIYREAISKEPGNPVSLTGLGRSYLMSGNSTLANAFLTKAVEADPAYSPARMARGNAWFDQKEFQLAATDFTAVIEADPTALEAFHNRGRARMQLQAFEEALSDFDAAKALNDELEDVRMDRVLALAQLGRTSDAQIELNEIIDMAPDNVAALMMRGRFYLALEDEDKAKADFVQAVTIDPNGPHVDEAMEHLHEMNRMDWSDY